MIRPQMSRLVVQFGWLVDAHHLGFLLAKEKGELPVSTDPAVLARLASAVIHTIAIRARARVPRKELETIVKGALDVMLGAASKDNGDDHR